MTSLALSRLAPAKINLFLHVTGRRDDGYHNLESLVVFAQDPAACDRVTATPADAISLAIEGPQAAHLTAAGDDNLVLRAAALLQPMNLQTGGARGAALTLSKTLPVASGIGGGSSDAAAALHCLRALWQIALDDDAISRAALKLGADVPACLYGRAVLMQGIGEQFSAPPSLPPFWLVLVNPGVALATRDVFAALAGQFGPPREGFAALERRAESAADLAILLRARRNDLEAPARFLAPEIDPVLAALKAQAGCLLARMSGSGATCFGLFATQKDADFAARNIGRAQPKWWVAATAAG